MAAENLDNEITLSFDDLLPDANGEIVVFSEGDPLQLSILTDQKVCASGIAMSHVTAGGVEVAGMPYFAFESGTTLYHSPDIGVTILPVHS